MRLNKTKVGYKKFLIYIAVFLVLLISVYFFNYDYRIHFVQKNDKIMYTLDRSEIFREQYGWEILDSDASIRMKSLIGDPKVLLKIDKNHDYLYLDINVSMIQKGNNLIKEANGEVYFTTDSQYTNEQRVTFELKKGHNIIRVPVKYKFDDMRIDFVSEKDITIDIKDIVITNYFRAKWFITVVFKAALIELLIGVLFLGPGIRRIRLKKIFTYLVSPVNNIAKEFFDYLKKNKIVVCTTFFVGIVSYGLLCTYYTIYIDEERQIIEACVTQDWLAQGRFGNYIFERFLLTGRIFTSYMGDVIAAALLCIAALLECFNLCKITGNKLSKFSQIIFCGLAISVPYVCGAYMVVGIYNIEISLAICLTAYATSCLFICDDKGFMKYIYALVSLFLAISIYQAFIPLFITQVVLCMLLYVWTSDEKVNIRTFFSQAAVSAGVCIVSTLIYLILNRIIINSIGGGSEYLSSSFVGWGKGIPVKDIVEKILLNILNVFTGSRDLLFGGVVFKITYFLYIIFILIRFITMKYNRGIFAILVFASAFVPFSLNFAIGSTMFAGRTLLGLPFLLGGIWLMILWQCSEQSFLKAAAGIVAAYLLFCQVQFINQYFLADFKRYQQDQIITQEIISDIREACNGYMQMPIVPVGTYYHEDNGLTTHYELAGSYYTVDGGSVSRIIRFMQAQGYNVDMPTPEQVADSCNHIHDMPVWPVKGSVKNINGYVIIKLSEPSEEWENRYCILPDEIKIGQ